MAQAVVHVNAGILAAMEQPKEHPAHTIHIDDDPNKDLEDDLRPEYRFDYSKLKARPNPYAERARKRRAEAREAETKEAENVQIKEG